MAVNEWALIDRVLINPSSNYMWAHFLEAPTMMFAMVEFNRNFILRIQLKLNTALLSTVRVSVRSSQA